jgi:outer membrane biosynthesis protein TonB
MIRIQSEDGHVLRLINAENSGTIHYTKTHGFVSERALQKREKMREARGGSVKKLPVFTVETNQDTKNISLSATGECEVEQLENLKWKLKSPAGNFVFDWQESTMDLAAGTTVARAKKEKESSRYFFIPLILSLLSLVFIFFKIGQEIATTNKIQENIQAPPVVVKPIEKIKVVEHAKPIEPTPPKNQAIDKQAKVQKALTQNLGFLKLMGRKDLKKAMGGLPTNVAEASPGAGPGGKEGSGGQLLVGLGQGLRKTTVGNSGLAGLGGIGTKGAGGGLGGYGETDYGSGAGKSVSAMPLSQEAVIEGGLDRSLIQATIMRYLSQVRACYEEGLKKKADLIGQVTMSFEISGQGNVNYSHVQRSSIGDREVETCISSRMMTWKFPVPRGNVNVKVSYPFMLRPVKS